MNHPLPATPRASAWSFEALVQGALANHWVRTDLRDLTSWPRVTAESIRRRPPVRLVFEHVTVIAPLGEAMSAARGKHFGAMEGVFPLEHNTPFHPLRVLFCYHASSPYSRRVEQRKAMKKALGKAHGRKLVNLAYRSTKGRFLAALATPEYQGAEARVRRLLGLEPGAFWRAASGKDWLDLPAPPVQTTFPFPMIPDEADQPEESER